MAAAAVREKSLGAHLAALWGLRAVVLAPDALAFGQAGELASDLMAVRLVISADFPDEVAGVLADMRAPFAGLVCGCGCGRWLGPENLLRVLLK
jgi:hypothetical protein